MARMLLAGLIVIQTFTYEQGYGNSNVADRSEYIRAEFLNLQAPLSCKLWKE